MQRKMLKAKIHQAVITEANLNYVGSLTIDRNLLEAADILVNEYVEIYNINNGARLATYAIEGEPGKGEICLNGAAARMGEEGDKVIICTYCEVNEEEIKTHKPTVLVMNEDNTIKETI